MVAVTSTETARSLKLWLKTRIEHKRFERESARKSARKDGEVRLRSTGLGKTELEGKIINVKRVDDVVIFFADVVKPVKWHVRMVFQERDLRKLVGAILKPKNLWYIIRALLFSQRQVHRTENF